MYPIEKYKYYIAKNKVIAVSSYAGKTVKGVATCHEDDEFTLWKGKELAAARCAIKVAKKRYDRATKKSKDAIRELDEAICRKSQANKYLTDSKREFKEALRHEKELLKSFK